MIPVIQNPNLILFLFIVDICIIFFILYHLNNIFYCECIVKKDETIVSDLQNIGIVEFFILFVYILNFFQLWKLTHLSISQIQILYHVQVVMVFLLIIMTILYCFLYYFITIIEPKVDITCDCFSVYFKYTLYFQIIIFSASYLVVGHQLFMQWLREKNYWK
jgi:hypothetical protein